MKRDLLRVEVPFGAFAAALIALAFVFAKSGIPPWLPSAPLVWIGIASPLTGMTRSFVALASGDLTAALRWHPVGPIVFVACIAMPVVAVVSWIRGARLEWLTALVRSRVVAASTAAAFALAWARQIVVLG